MKTPFWHFWDPMSGLFGGVIAGTIIATAILAVSGLLRLPNFCGW